MFLPSSLARPLKFGLFALVWCISYSPRGLATEPHSSRCIAVEVYQTSEEAKHQEAIVSLERQLAARPGLAVRWFHTFQDALSQRRYQAICGYCKIEPGSQNSIVYAGGRAVVLDRRQGSWVSEVEALFRFELFSRRGCSRCARAIPWTKSALAAYQGVSLEVHDVVDDPSAATRLAGLAKQYRTPAVSYPAFHFFGQLVVGWEDEQTSGQRILATLDRWSKPCVSQERSEGDGERPESTGGARTVDGAFPLFITPDPVRVSGATATTTRSSQQQNSPDGDDELLPIGQPEQPDDQRSDRHLAETAPPAATAAPRAASGPADALTLPLLGEVRVSTIGLPLFTLSVGLVDGFNPCAMWVLLFLLSVLVNLGNRLKMLVVAGTFVLISALAYFAFIAAWLSVFQWVGLLRSVQVALAVLAITIGLIHVKDFFAFHRGLTLSIPESAKPRIYTRVQKIVLAESLWTALAGAIVLAVMVNFIELLCTAGLPCLYSQILTMQQLPRWQEYLYLGLYIAAYMFDDTLMVTGVVISLGKPKMQEVHGRWLKLLSGAVILSLGIIMLVRPDWLS